MTDRHKHQPITFRPPEDDRAWLLAYAEQTGQPVRRVLTLALAAYRAAMSGDTTPAPAPQVETPQAKVESPRRPARKRAASEATPEIPAAKPAECGHTYPDVRNIAGRRVCRKCP